MDIAHQIQKLKAAIASKEIELFNFTVFPPVERYLFVQVEQVIKFRLPDLLKEFYSCTNGLQVRWQYRKNEILYKEDISRSGNPFPCLWPAEHYWQLDGLINILPLQEVFLKDYKDFIWFDFENKYTVKWKDREIGLDHFKRAIKPLDIFDKYHTVGIYVADPEFPLLLGEDHNANFEHYKPTTFEDYFNFLGRSLGEVNKRKQFFEQL